MTPFDDVLNVLCSSMSAPMINVYVYRVVLLCYCTCYVLDSVHAQNNQFLSANGISEPIICHLLNIHNENRIKKNHAMVNVSKWRNSFNRLSQLVACMERSVSAIWLWTEQFKSDTQYMFSIRYGEGAFFSSLIMLSLVFVIVFFCVCTPNEKKDKGTCTVVLYFN